MQKKKYGQQKTCLTLMELARAFPNIAQQVCFHPKQSTFNSLVGRVPRSKQKGPSGYKRTTDTQTSILLIIMSNIQCLTLISDQTEEFPKNANNSFKVRLPERLSLQGDQWYATLMFSTVPEQGQSTGVIATDPHTNVTEFRLQDIQRGQSLADTWSNRGEQLKRRLKRKAPALAWKVGKHQAKRTAKNTYKRATQRVRDIFGL